MNILQVAICPITSHFFMIFFTIPITMKVERANCQKSLHCTSNFQSILSNIIHYHHMRTYERIHMCLPLCNTTLEAYTVKIATDRNWQSTILVPLKELFAFFFVCRPSWCRKLLRHMLDARWKFSFQIHSTHNWNLVNKCCNRELKEWNFHIS